MPSKITWEWDEFALPDLKFTSTMPSCFADESVSIPEVQQQFYRTAHAHKFVMVSDWQKNKGLPKQKHTTLKGDM